MPIVYSEKDGGWHATDLTDQEKQSLVNIAAEVITDAMGAQLADRIMQAAGAKMALEDTPPEDMYNA